MNNKMRLLHFSLKSVEDKSTVLTVLHFLPSANCRAFLSTKIFELLHYSSNVSNSSLFDISTIIYMRIHQPFVIEQYVFHEMIMPFSNFDAFTYR